MTSSVMQWIVFLQRIDPLIGVPLVIGGLSIMAFGWRAWKLLVVASFAVLGLLAPMFVISDQSDALWYGAGGCLLLGLVSFYTVRWSLLALGGLVGAAILGPVLEGIGLRGPALCAGMGVAFCGAAGMAAINQRYLIVLVTAFEGAVLLMSGVAALMTSNPKMLTTFQGMATGNALVMGFCILVPTVMSFFYQISEVNRLGHET
jgi:hypothetical protein